MELGKRKRRRDDHPKRLQQIVAMERNLNTPVHNVNCSADVEFHFI